MFFAALLRALQRFHHVDLPALPRHQQAHRQGDAEGQQHADAVGRRTQHELQLVFSGQGREQPLEDSHRGGQADDHTQHGEPDILGNEKAAQLPVPEAQDLQRGQLPAPAQNPGT